MGQSVAAMDKPVEARLNDLIEVIDQTQIMMTDIDFETFAADRLRQRAAERAIEIVAETSRKLPAELKAAAPHLDWQRMITIREFLWDYYYAVDAQLIWDVVHDDLPPFREFACQFLPDSGVTT